MVYIRNSKKLVVKFYNRENIMEHKRLLLVDDNDKYAKILSDYFESRGYKIDRAYFGNEALEILKNKGVNYYSVILTDITMETQLAGLKFLKNARKLGFKGKIIIASTGFNYNFSLMLAPVFLTNLGVDYLIPKVSVLNHNIEFYSCKLFPKKEDEILLT